MTIGEFFAGIRQGFADMWRGFLNIPLADVLTFLGTAVAVIVVAALLFAGLSAGVMATDALLEKKRPGVHKTMHSDLLARFRSETPVARWVSRIVGLPFLYLLMLLAGTALGMLTIWSLGTM